MEAHQSETVIQTLFSLECICKLGLQHYQHFLEKQHNGCLASEKQRF